jgi:hypothetical protein
VWYWPTENVNLFRRFGRYIEFIKDVESKELIYRADEKMKKKI